MPIDTIYMPQDLYLPSHYLQRQWKLRKAHLPQWDSLPNLHLIPKERPIFKCFHCGFSSTPPLPICVFCKWSSAYAQQQFENFLLRPRRRRSWTPSQPVHVALPVKLHSDARTGNAPGVNDEATIGPLSFQATQCHSPRSQIGENRALLSASSDEVETKSSSSRSARAIGSRSVSKVTVRISSPTVDKVEPAGVVDSPSYSLHFQGETGLSLQASSPSNVDQAIITTTMTRRSLRTPSISKRRLVVDLRRSVDSSAHRVSFDPQQSTVTAERTLKRKKNVQSLRVPSDLDEDSIPLRHSMDERRDSERKVVSPVPTAISSPASIPITKLRHQRSHSSPTSLGRLGHPSRPYYSAIRKDMSRPNSAMSDYGCGSRPTSVAISSRAPSPSPSGTNPFSPPLSVNGNGNVSAFRTFHDDVISPMLSPPSTGNTTHSVPSRSVGFGFLSPPPLSGSSTLGFSLSGETEMRMALAREGKETGFKVKAHRKSHGQSSMRDSIQKLREGIKNIWRTTGS